LKWFLAALLTRKSSLPPVFCFTISTAAAISDGLVVSSVMGVMFSRPAIHVMREGLRAVAKTVCVSLVV
jgi:hypothetical protein